MDKIESDVNQERLLARTLIDLRQAYTRARMLLPALSMPEMLMLSGAIEQAKTEGMKTRTEVKALPASKRKQEAATDEVGLNEDEFPVASGSLSVTAGKTRVHMAVAAAKILAKDGPLSVRGLLEAIEARGWKLDSKSPNAPQIVRNFLKRNAKYFGSSVKDGEVRFRLKGAKVVEALPKRTAKKTPWRQKKDERNASRVMIIKALEKVSGPVSIRDIAEKMGRDTGAGIVPVMVALQDAGAVKKVKKDGDTLWDPNPEKLRDYKTSLNGMFTKDHVNVLNGVSHG